MCKEKRPAHSLCTRCNKWLCSPCTEEHRHGKEPGERFLSVSLKGCTGTGTHGNCLSSPVSNSGTKGAVAGSVPQTPGSLWLRRTCMCQWETGGFFSNLRAITTISIPWCWKKILDIFVSQIKSSPCAFPIYGTGLGGLQQQQALPFQSFCPNLGNFIEETMTKQFLCIWTSCVRESQIAKDCDHYRMLLS